MNVCVPHLNCALTVASDSDCRSSLLMVDDALCYRRKSVSYAQFPAFAASFAAMNSSQIMTAKSLDTKWRYVRSAARKLHPIRAETLFTNSACLRRQIFIPYAPISRSVGYGASRPQSCRRRSITHINRNGVQLGSGVAVLPNRPLGELDAHAQGCEHDACVAVCRGRVPGTLRNLDIHVTGAGPNCSGNQRNLTI
jgi:hypothetical protein